VTASTSHWCLHIEAACKAEKTLSISLKPVFVESVSIRVEGLETERQLLVATFSSGKRTAQVLIAGVMECGKYQGSNFGSNFGSQQFRPQSCTRPSEVAAVRSSCRSSCPESFPGVWEGQGRVVNKQLILGTDMATKAVSA
jgi:hypothetical protein